MSALDSMQVRKLTTEERIEALEKQSTIDKQKIKSLEQRLERLELEK